MKIKSSFWEWLYMIFAVISLWITFVPIEKYRIANNILYLLFFIEYVVRCYRSEDKIRFIVSHPLDLVILLPVGSSFRVIRLLRLFKILKIGEKIKERLPRVFEIFRANDFGLLIGWLIFSSMAVSIPLTLFEPNMKNYFDALWWTIVTTTTVGYGDIVPVTWLGKIVAIFLMIFGIGITGVLIGNISKILVNNRTSEELMTEFADFEDLSDIAKERIRRRIREEIELELFKSSKHRK
ncbi:MAG: ion channel [Peptostreptococcaceae bacterium]|nr:ion channel [Peptostreptococcaceae bacterium]